MVRKKSYVIHDDSIIIDDSSRWIYNGDAVLRFSKQDQLCLTKR